MPVCKNYFTKYHNITVTIWSYHKRDLLWSSTMDLVHTRKWVVNSPLTIYVRLYMRSWTVVNSVDLIWQTFIKMSYMWLVLLSIWWSWSIHNLYLHKQDTKHRKKKKVKVIYIIVITSNAAAMKLVISLKRNLLMMVVRISGMSFLSKVVFEVVSSGWTLRDHSNPPAISVFLLQIHWR